MITKSETITNITQNEDGTESIKQTITETSFSKDREPDYIKIYTKMWCEFRGVPIPYRQLFLELVMRMSYCNSNDLEHSQLVNTCKPWADALIQACGWTSSDSLMKGLRALTNCGAIRKISRGVYQINPNYAGRGSWKYNPTQDQGGIKDLVAQFNFKTNEVETKIVWADDGQDTDFNDMYREGLQVKKSDNAIIKTMEGITVNERETSEDFNDVISKIV